MRKALFLLLSALLMQLAIFAQTNTWTGNTSTNWNTATNWSTAQVPTAANDVVIPSTGNQPTISVAGAVAHSMEVQANAVLTINNGSSLSVNGSKDVGVFNTAFYNEGKVNNSGQLFIGNTSTAGNVGLWNFATLNNNASGQITVDRTGYMGLYNQATFNNAGNLGIGSVEGIGEYGIWNQANFNNSGGQITIDRSTSFAFYNNLSGIFNNAASFAIGSKESAGNTGLYNSATFNNNAGGQIAIDRTTSTGLYNTSNFTNLATINIGALQSIGQTGLWNTASFQNKEGLITVDRSASRGLYNETGTFNNTAALNLGKVESVGATGLYNKATFNNDLGGQISIDRSATISLYNSASTGDFTNKATITIGAVAAAGKIGLQNQGSFSNNQGGLIQIDRSATDGIANQDGTFTNAADITIGALQSVGEAAIYNKAIFNNDQGGQIKLDRSTQAGLANISGSFTNSATITIGSLGSTGQYGIYSLATFNNSGCTALLQIVSDNIVSGGSDFGNTGTIIENGSGNSDIGSNSGLVQNLAGGTFAITNNTGLLTTDASSFWKGCTNTAWNEATNWSTGKVPTASDDVVILNVTNQPIIGTSVAAHSVEIQSGAVLTTNSTGILAVNGSKDFGETTIAFYNAGTINNIGQLWIGNVSSAGKVGLRNLGTFNNAAVGKVTIDRTTATGLYNAEGTFNNGGSITIGGVSVVGNYGIYNTASFDNSAGQIKIDRSSIAALDNVSGTFTNAATINIGSVANVGFHGIWNQATFNNTGGQISIDRYSINGLRNSGGNFTNAANLTVANVVTAGVYGLYNAASFANNGCAVATLFAPVYNQGNVINKGLFTVNTSASHTNSSSFVNNGVLVYPQGNAIPNVTNGAVIVTPLNACGTTVTPALELGSSNTFIIGSTWYKNAALTTLAGSYTIDNNTFTASGLSVGSTATVYFTVSDGSACTRVVDIPVTLNQQITFYADKDGDGYGDASNKTAICTANPPAGYVSDNTDCNDDPASDGANQHPNQTWYIDADGDGYSAGNSAVQCTRPVHGYLLSELKGTTDCNDGDKAVHASPAVSSSSGNIAKFTDWGLCTAKADYTVSFGGDNLVISYQFSGATMATGAGTGSGASFNKGITVVKVTATNSCSNAICSFTVTVTDNEKPTITCPSTITVNPTSLNGAVVNYTAPIGKDNCSNFTITRTSATNTASGSTFPIGGTAVNYKVTDASGNTATCLFSVTVRNPYVDNKKQKVYVCHNSNTLSINAKDLQNHLAHGDKLGRCEWYTSNTLTVNREGQSIPNENALATTGSVYPNPTTGRFTLQLNTAKAGMAQMSVLDSKGGMLSQKNLQLQAGLQTIAMDLHGKASGLYLIKLTTEDGAQTYKVFLQQ